MCAASVKASRAGGAKKEDEEKGLDMLQCIIFSPATEGTMCRESPLASRNLCNGFCVTKLS
jgi:hypothetical protein